jgi:sec-independent protein translocase protein TatA
MFRNFGAPEIIILVVLLVLILGWKRLPDAARSLGRSMRIFKSEVQEMKNDGRPSAASGDTVRGEAVREDEHRTDSQSGTAGPAAGPGSAPGTGPGSAPGA